MHTGVDRCIIMKCKLEKMVFLTDGTILAEGDITKCNCCASSAAAGVWRYLHTSTEMCKYQYIW